MPVPECDTSITVDLNVSPPATPSHNKFLNDLSTPNASTFQADIESDDEEFTNSFTVQNNTTCDTTMGLNDEPVLGNQSHFKNIGQQFKPLKPLATCIFQDTESKRSDTKSINGSILNMIDQLGTTLESDDEIEIRFSSELMNTENSNHSKDDNFDFISLQMSSDDDCESRVRFERFFEMEYAASSCGESFIDNASENAFSNSINFVSRPVTPQKLPILKQNQIIHTDVYRSDDEEPDYAPPPYTEMARPPSVYLKTPTKPRVLPTIITPSPKSSRRKISVKIKKSNKDLMQTANDDYRLDRYLPPYRSLLNPNKVFDYRTNSFVETTPNTRIVTVHQKTNGNDRIVSLVIKANTPSIAPTQSSAVDTDSNEHTAPTHQIDVHTYKTKPSAQFKDLSDDIVKKILGCLSNQKDILNSMYVSKQFQKNSTPLLYYYPKFTSTYRVAQFVHTILNNSELSKLVKILDLSNIDFPVHLTKLERQKYQDNLIYGSNRSTNVLKDTSKIVYAGWRDWKYRNHPIYGSLKRSRSRSSSISSSIASTSSLASQYDINVMTQKYLPVISRINSSSQIPERSAANFTHKSRSMSMSNLKVPDDGFLSNLKRLFDSKSKSKSHDVIPKSKSMRDIKTQSIKTRETNPARKKKKFVQIDTETKTEEEQSSRVRQSVTFESDNSNVNTPHVYPFCTPHPRMGSTLRKYCFKRDIPVGYVIHILEECTEIEEINFNRVIFSPDYKLCDYHSFDWNTGVGVIGKQRNDSNRPIFSSDTDREISLETDFVCNGIIETMEVKKIWELLLTLRHVRSISLNNINSLEQTMLYKFVYDSKFSQSLQVMSCEESGMIRRDEWDVLKTVEQWRAYLDK